MVFRLITETIILFCECSDMLAIEFSKIKMNAINSCIFLSFLSFFAHFIKLVK